MSTIGPGGLGFVPIVGSAAGAQGQQRVAGANQAAGEAAERTFQLQRQAQMEKAVGDVAASDEAGDRDADGREPWRLIERRGGSEDGSETPHRPPDPDNERGGALDLEA